MESRISAIDFRYKVEFARPAFSQIGTFTQIIEPLYDAFFDEIPNISEAIELKIGNTIASSSVVLPIRTGSAFSLLEVKLDQLEARSTKVETSQEIGRIVRHIDLFESAVYQYFTNVVPAMWSFQSSFWLVLDEDNPIEKCEYLIRKFSFSPESHDLFEIGATRVRSKIALDCINDEDQWNVEIFLDRSVLIDSHLFLQINGNYKSDPEMDSFEKKFDYLFDVLGSIVAKLGLTLKPIKFDE